MAMTTRPLEARGDARGQREDLGAELGGVAGAPDGRETQWPTPPPASVRTSGVKPVNRSRSHERPAGACDRATPARACSPRETRRTS